MRPLLIALLAAAGLVIGPVLRLLIVRLSVPSGQPWRRGCPACDHPLPWTRGAPQPTPAAAAVSPPAGPTPAITPASARSARAASGLRAAVAALPVLPATGRCPGCRARLGPPVLTVEVTAAVLFGLLALRIHPGLVLTAVCWLAVCTIPLAYIDAASHRLPDLLTAPAFAGTAVVLLSAAAAAEGWSRLGRGLLGGVAYAAFCLILFLISPSGMGPGDVKLAASLGAALAWLGWGSLIAGVLAGFALGAIYGVILLARGRASRKTQLPFGPFMIAGTFLVLVITGLPG